MRSPSSSESSPHTKRTRWKSVISRARAVSNIYKNNASKDDEVKSLEDKEVTKEAAEYNMKSRKGYSSNITRLLEIKIIIYFLHLILYNAMVCL